MFSLRIADAVAVLTLGRPPVNAIGEEWLRLIDARLDDLAARSDWQVLHIRSDQKVFCAGADLNELRQRLEAGDGPDQMYAHVAGIQRLYVRLEQMPQVTLVEIGGAALGGGLELALACDLRIAAIDATLGLPETRLGLIPGAGGTQRLSRLCGPALAARLILGAETVDGATARELGIVQWAVPHADLPTHAAALATRIAGLPAAALAAAKACIAAAGEPGRGGFHDELEATRRLLGDAETRQRIQAFFACRAAESGPPATRAGA
jgi:enoyl-CoA hydratase